jgi:hypothetical protein
MGGLARAKTLTAAERKAISEKAARAAAKVHKAKAAKKAKSAHA